MQLHKNSLNIEFVVGKILSDFMLFVELILYLIKNFCSKEV